MRLSRLEIFGFKSFAKKLDLRLLGGITGVVGPNGCGKTNVVDAIRWVLGEQRPAKIRLDSMGDVIFKGSNTRRPLGMAEVSLTIENQSGILPLDLPEVTITRRLYRSGESEYLINRKPCRLADINDMFMDTGMGSDSYSMFEQGMINAILSDKAEDRRHIFEEAAGITKYKARRKSALNTLVGIEGDLARLGDLTAELTKRVDSLKRQASKASRYRTLKSEIKARTLTLGAFEIGRQKQKLRTVHEALNAVESEAASSRAVIESGSSDIERLSAGIGALEQTLAALAGQYESVIRTIAEKENESVRIESRLESLGEMIQRSRDTARRNAQTLDQLAGQHSARATDLETVRKKLAEIESLTTRAAEEHRVLANRLGELTNGLKAADQEVRSLERSIESGAARLSMIASRRAEGSQRLADIDARERELIETAGALERDRKALEQKHADHTGALGKITATREGLLRKQTDRLAERDRVLNERNNAAERRAVIAAEFEFTDRLLASLDGYDDGVRSAVGAACLAGRVGGVLADLVSVEERFLPAVEAALAGSLQHVVVDDADAAAAGAAWLAEEPRGRAVLIPAEGVEDSQPSQTPDSEPDVIGCAASFVKTGDRYRPLVNRLIGDVYLVRTLDAAIRLSRVYPQVRFATLTGEMTGTGGEIHSGRAVTDSGMMTLGRIEKRTALEQQLAVTGDELAAYAKKLAILDDNCAFLRGALAESERDMNTAREHLGETASGLARLAARREAAGAATVQLDRERAVIAESFKTMAREEEDTTREIAVLREKLAEIENRRRTIKQDADELAAEIEEHRERLSAGEVARAGYREKSAALRHELETIGERRESLARAARRAQDEIEQAEVEILAHGERKTVIAQALGELAATREAHEQRKTEKSTQLAKLRSLRREKEETLQKQRLALVEIANRESALKLEKDEASMIMENIVQRLTDEFFITPGEIPGTAPDDEDFTPETEKEALAELRRRLHLIGDVNLAAEEEYNREKARLDFLSAEYQDLTEARDTLMKTISRINHIAVERFRETFDRIRENFQGTFRQFFEGGVCDLELAENEDPLEAAILITARPPGKNVNSISLLSSGERALTAISLLFSIYMVKPSPFCILDEVDAPLDDANIDRFLRVIGDFSARTQFIMVTHNKKTMSRAHNLYGITMEEPGLSSLVSVRLSEVNTYDDQQRLAGEQNRQDDTIPVPGH